jgi:hypothetical protein
MFKKTLFSIGLALCLLLTSFAPALADAPDIMWYDSPAFTYIAADCSQYGYAFTIAHTWDEEGQMRTYYNKDSSFDYVIWHATAVHTFKNTESGKWVAGTTTTNLISRDLSGSTFEFHGYFQRIIVPGVGPIFMDGGGKIFA